MITTISPSPRAELTSSWPVGCQELFGSCQTSSWRVVGPTAGQCHWLCYPCREGYPSGKAPQTLATQTLHRHQAVAPGSEIQKHHTRCFLGCFSSVSELSKLKKTPLCFHGESLAVLSRREAKSIQQSKLWLPHPELDVSEVTSERCQLHEYTKGNQKDK